MRKFLTASAAAIGLAGGLGGCAAVRSTPVDVSRHTPPTGLQYAAPKALFAVELIERANQGGLALSISQPMFVGDSEASYMLDGASGLLANQEYYFVVDPDTRLLSFVDSTSQGQAGQILRNLAQSVGGVGATQEETSAALPGDRVIYSRIFDPFESSDCNFGTRCSFETIGAQLRQGALNYFHCGDENQPANAKKEALCQRISANPDFFSITLNPMFSASAGVVEPADCRRALCYRAPAPYAMSLTVAGVSDTSEIVFLPNEAPIMALPIPAGVFANSQAFVEMYDGMPAHYSVDRQNELVAITLVPFQIVTEGFNAASRVFQLRVNYNSERERYRRSRPVEAPPAARASEAGFAATELEGADASDQGGDTGEENSALAAERRTSAEQRQSQQTRPTGPLFKVELIPDAAPQGGSGSDVGGNG